MPQKLLMLAAKHGIEVVFWDFAPPLEAVYWTYPGLPPYIGLSRRILSSTAYFRSILAEELGHHFTTVGQALPKAYFHYRDRLAVSKAEQLALRWAAKYLMPYSRMKKAIKEGAKEIWELAEYFNVTEELVRVRLSLADIQQLKNFYLHSRTYVL